MIELSNDDVLQVRIELLLQILDIIFLGGSLFVFRAREWPPLFSIGINDMRTARDNERNRLSSLATF
jgi:hypothetical protein